MPPLLLFVVHAATITETNSAADINQLTVVLSNFLGIATALAGMVAVVTIIFGGFKYMVAHGDPKAVSGARSTIIWAVVGLIFLVVAYLVLRLIEEVTGVKVTQFRIPS